MSVAHNDRCICIHGHFYQPPRENPWLETVEVQESAAPYHDWNERVTAECYAPNAAARLLDEHQHITALRNNYNRISFNFGPTLLSWVERARPDVYAQILLADQESARHFGNGNAIAQVYGHCIMPLASRHDQQTQVRWGIADFVHRFGRVPHGMWLPETAVDRASLTMLAENGMRFTILAPSQAARVRYDEGAWQPVHDGRIDTTRPYRCALGSGRAITLFFYDADIAHAVAFTGLLRDGHDLARRLIDACGDRTGPHLVHIATDGESYGHHHRFGDMALAAALESLEGDHQVQLTNYATFLDRVGVRDEVEIHDQSSWSCAHGVERWRSNCGCHVGHPDWQQAWRAPLREALDWLKEQLDRLFERHAEPLLHDPWAARDDYVTLILRRDAHRCESFLAQHAPVPPDAEHRVRIWRLLEMQRCALLSFTSCGWFFDEPSGTETVQVLTYAARALQLAGQFGANLEPEFLRHLQLLRSNLPIYANGRQLYGALVRPTVADGSRIVAHDAMSTLLTAPERDHRVYVYRVTVLDQTIERAGAARMAVGRVRLTAEVTEESGDYAYTALHVGGHDMHCAVAARATAADYARLQAALVTTFRSEPVAEIVRRIDHAFGGVLYTLRDVFDAERRRVLDLAMEPVTAECTADYERIVAHNRRLLDFLAQAQVPVPDVLRVAATFVVQRHLEQAMRRFAAGDAGADEVLSVSNDASRWKISPALERVQQILETGLLDAVTRCAAGHVESGLARAHAVLDLAQVLGLSLNTWETQNQYYVFITTETQQRWPAQMVAELRRLGERLSFHLREWDTLVTRAA